MTTGTAATRCVLVVDDDAALLETLALQLHASGWVVDCAGSGSEAMERLATRAPDVVLTDVRLPGVDGIELLRLIQRRCPGVPVIVMTGHEGMDTAVRAMRNGALEYLAKPLDLDEIERVLARSVQAAGRDAGTAPDRGPADPLAMVGTHASMIAAFKAIGLLARSRSPVLVRGETGTGKELAARAIHANSPWAQEPFVAVNCSAVPESLLASELFGHARGSFTGAIAARKGRFELAGEGTIMLDEIGDTSLEVQAALLRVLDEAMIVPVGGERAVRVSARVIAATHRPLEAMVREGRFREDLYYRLHAAEIRLPPLRKRASDIPALVRHLLPMVSAAAGVPEPAFDTTVLEALRAYDWPGNVRQLRQALLRGALAARGGPLRVEDLRLVPVELLTPDGGEAAPASSHAESDASLDSAITRHVEDALAKAGYNKRQAARDLGISRTRLDRILAARTPGGRDASTST